MTTSTPSPNPLRKALEDFVTLAEGHLRAVRAITPRELQGAAEQARSALAADDAAGGWRTVYESASIAIPLADVQHVEKRQQPVAGLVIVTKHTRWNFEQDGWDNNIWLGQDEAEAFLAAWRTYRGAIDLLPSPAGAGEKEDRR